MRSLSRGWAGVFGLAVFAVATTPVSAGLSYVSQERRVEARTGDYTTPDPIDNGPFAARSANGFGPFSATVASDHINASNQLDTASASQASRLDPSSLRATGSFAGNAGDDLVQYRSLFRLRFEISAATPFDLSASFALDDFKLNSFHLDDPLYTLQFGRVGGPLLADHRVTDFDLFESSDLSRSFSAHGTLSPGRYDLLLEVRTEFAQGDEAGRYDVALDIGGDGSGNPPPAVPLPAGALLGLVTMAGIAASQAAQRWRAHRVREAS